MIPNNMYQIPTQENQAIGFMQGSMYSSKRASLYLFTPKNLSDQYRRPHVYKFDFGFIDGLQNTIEDNRQRNVNVNMSSYMVGNQNALTAVMPNMHGIPIQTDTLRSVWTFILVVDNDKDPTIDLLVKINSRAIYSGYCSDEPISVGHNGMTPAPNLNCFFIVTHRNFINSQFGLNMTGVVTPTYTTANVDVLPADHILATSAVPEIYNLTPKAINRAISNNIDGTVTAVVGNHGLLQRRYGEDNPVVCAEFASPRHHMHSIANQVQKAVINSHPLIDNNEDAMFIAGGGMSLTENAFETFINADTPTTMFDSLNSNQPFSFQDLLRKYPDLNIVDCRAPVNTPWQNDVGSQASPTIMNVANSMLSSTVPYLLSELQLSDVSFRYASYMTDGVSPERGIDTCFSVASLVPLTDAVKYQKYKNLIERLRVLVFPMMEQMNGAFDLMMVCSLAGPSVIDLHFMDSRNSYNGFYETNNLFGGFNTPLVGNRDIYENNINEFGKLKSAIIEAVPTYMNNTPR